MRLYAQLTTAVAFSGITLLTTLIVLLLRRPLGGEQALFQLSPSLVYTMVWPPALAALLLGAALGRLFQRTARLRLGLLYAVCLGLLISVPVMYLGHSGFSEAAFTLTFLAFDKPGVPVPVEITVLSGRTEKSVGSQSIWLIGPLTGILVWAPLRRSHRQASRV